MPTDLRDLDAAGLLCVAVEVEKARRLAEVASQHVLLQWAALHSLDPLEGLDADERRRAKKVGNTLRFLGGEGTPGVQDFALGEIAIARGVHLLKLHSQMADALDLAHRMPETWAVLQDGEAEPWVACLVASRSRRLPADRMWIVDQAVARMIAREATSRTLDVADAKIAEADPARVEALAEQAEQTRFAAVSQSDPDGMRMLVSRMTAADAAGVDATLDFLASQILTAHPDTSLDERRSMALGMFGRLPQLITTMLKGIDLAADPADPDTLAGPFAFPAEILDALRDPTIAARIAPQATLYLHLHEAVLLGVDGVARVEGLSHYTLSQLQVLLAGHHVTVKPVIDLSDRVTTTAYEHPEAIKERVHLTTGGDYWPYASSTGRRLDHDHPTPYDHHAPPDARPQTGTHNSGPLGRRHHRLKTFAGYRSRQCGHGRYVWETPHGLTYLVDHRGTRPINPDHARQMFDVGDNVELYFPEQPITVELDLPG